MSNVVLDYHKYSRKWGKVGPSHLLSENGDLSFLLFFFSKTVLDRELSRKASKKFIGSFYFWEIIFKSCFCKLLFCHE